VSRSGLGSRGLRAFSDGVLSLLGCGQSYSVDLGLVVFSDSDDLYWASRSRGTTTNSNSDGLGDSLRDRAVVGNGDNGSLSGMSRLVSRWLRSLSGVGWLVRSGLGRSRCVVSLSGVDWLVCGWLGRSRHVRSLSGLVGMVCRSSRGHVMSLGEPGAVVRGLARSSHWSAAGHERGLGSGVGSSDIVRVLRVAGRRRLLGCVAGVTGGVRSLRLRAARCYIASRVRYNRLGA
jgi:hypothetical protein